MAQYDMLDDMVAYSMVRHGSARCRAKRQLSTKAIGLIGSSARDFPAITTVSVLLTVCRAGFDRAWDGGGSWGGGEGGIVVASRA